LYCSSVILAILPLIVAAMTIERLLDQLLGSVVDFIEAMPMTLLHGVTRHGAAF
jgi:hypothetical protein